MRKIFAERKMKADGLVLPLEEFKLFLDMKNPKFTTKRLKAIVKRAEADLDKDIPFLPLSLYREFNLIGNRANYEHKYFERREMALRLAMAEAFERKGRFTDKLCDAVWAILEETSWIIPAHTSHSPSRPGTDVPEVYDDSRIHGIDLFSAGTSGMLATILYLCRDILDEVHPVIAERMEIEIYKRGIFPFYNCVFGWSGRKGNKVNNWCPWCTSNTLFAIALLEKDLTKRTLAVNKAMSFLDNFISGYGEDGGCDEGPTYWNVAGGALFDGLELIYDMTGGKVSIFDDPLILAIGEYEAKFCIHADRYVNFADAGGRCRPDGTLLARYGKRCASEELVAFGKMTSLSNDLGISLNLAYRNLKNAMSPVYTKAETTKASLKTWFSELKVMISRESEDTSKGMFLAMKGGHNSESHNHNDIGNFMVYSDGEPVLIDVGVGQYTKQTFSPDRYKIWFMQSGYHTLPSFGGVDQMQGGEYRSRDDVYDPEEGSYCAEIGGAYPAEAGVVSYRRCGVLKDGTVSVSDSITLKEKKEIDFHFMSAVEPVLLEKGKIALAAGCVLEYDGALECEIEKFLSVGLNAKSTWGSEYLYRIHLKVTTDKIDTVFRIKKA